MARAVSTRPPVQIVHCAAYGGPYRGSFIPMLEAVAREARHRDYPPATMIFAEAARERPWVPALAAVANLEFFDPGASRGGLTQATMGMLAAAVGARPGPAVIHTHFAAFDVPAALMRLRLPRHHLGVFWHEHGPILDDPGVRLRNAIRYATVGRLVNGMLCVSPELRAELRARQAPADRLLDFPNAIDTDVFRPPTAQQRAAARRGLGVADDARVVLHFGWDWERKGGDLLLAAAALLAGERDVVVLTVLAEGAALPSGAPANVRGLPPTDDVSRLFAAADVFLSASRAEGALPLAALEALACGLPIVVSDIPMQERLTGGLPGAISAPAQPQPIADALAAMLALGEAERARHAALVRERFAAFFALDAWARRLVDLYERTLG